jgi:hypothetical protein
MCALGHLFAQHELERHPWNMKDVAVTGFNSDGVGKIEGEMWEFQS